MMICLFVKNIKIKYELDEVNAKIDKEKLTQVIVNLISNAIRYSNENGCILIRLYKENDFVNGANIIVDGGMTKKMIYVE